MSSAAATTASGTPAPNIPPATQVVPSIGLDGKPTTTASPSSDNGGNHFPTAAAVLVGICAGIAGLYLVYKLYRLRFRRWRDQGTQEDPPRLETRTLNHATSPMNAGFASLPSQMSVAGGFDSLGRRSTSGMDTLARSRQASWGGDSWGGFEKSDFSPSPTYAGTPIATGSPTRDDLPGSMNASRASLGALPSSASHMSFDAAPPRRPFYSSSAAGSQHLHSRAASTFSVSSPHLAGASNVRDFPSGNRLAGAPHNPASRIEVVPPSPLAPPPGSVIATDKSTLDFAPSSGIGRDGAHDVGGDEWFAAAAAAAALGQPHAAQDDEYEERLDPAYDGTYGTGPSLSPASHSHSFPPSGPSSSAGSSRASSSVPRSARHAVKRPSNVNIRSNAASANSSDSNLSSVSGGSAAPPPVPGPGPAPASSPATTAPHRRAHPHLTVRTSSLGLGDAAEPRSPLEKLRMRAEQEAKGLSLQSEEVASSRRAEDEGR